jgi:hypothetical protein
MTYHSSVYLEDDEDGDFLGQLERENDDSRDDVPVEDDV